MNYEKYKGKAARDVVLHNGRAGDDQHNHKNEEIDKTRTHLNYDLIEREKGISAFAFFNQKIAAIKSAFKEQNGKEIRKDAVTLCSWCLQFPKDLDSSKEREFFEGAVEFFKERYPECIPVTATVHKDETRPHLHYSFIPIQKGRLCAKDLETRKSLNTAHQECEKFLSDKLGCDVHLLTPDNPTLANKSIDKLKLDSLRDMQIAEGKRISKLFDKVAEKIKLGKPLNKQERLFFDKLSEHFDTFEQINKTAQERSETLNKLVKDKEGNLITTAKVMALRATEELSKGYKEEIATLQRENKSLKADKQRAERLEQFCDTLQYGDGRSVLEVFEEQEQKNRKIERSKKSEIER